MPLVGMISKDVPFCVHHRHHRTATIILGRFSDVNAFPMEAAQYYCPSQQQRLSLRKDINLLDIFICVYERQIMEDLRVSADYGMEFILPP